MKYQVISDSSCDLPGEIIEERKIKVVPFYVAFGDEEYKQEIVDIEAKDFFAQMIEKKGVYPKTSCPSVQDFYDVFENYVQKKMPVICICITTKFSGSMQAALNAKNMILEEYEDAQITVIDSQVNTVLQGMYTLEACRLRDEDCEYEEAVERLLNIRDTGRIFFTIGSIDYLQHGGRIGKVAGIAANLLNIKPMITLKDGEIFSSGMARSRKKSLDKVIDMLLSYVEEQVDDMSNYNLCIGYGSSIQEGADFRKLVLEHLGEYGIDDIPLRQIGAAIGVHTGPYPIGIAILRKA